MSILYKCDCCGKTVNTNYEKNKYKKISITGKDTSCSYDVCKECLTKIEKILNQNAKIEEKAQSDNKPDCFGTYNEDYPCKNGGCNLKKECIETDNEDDEDWK